MDEKANLERESCVLSSMLSILKARVQEGERVLVLQLPCTLDEVRFLNGCGARSVR